MDGYSGGRMDSWRVATRMLEDLGLETRGCRSFSPGARLDDVCQGWMNIHG